MFCRGGAFAADVTIGNFAITYGKVGSNAILDFVPRQMLHEKWQSDEAIGHLRDFLDITRELSPAEKREIELATAYWAERMAGNRPAGLANIYVGFVDDPRYGAFSLFPEWYLVKDLTAGISPNGTVYDKFIYGRPSPYPPGLADNIIIFNLPFSTEPTRQLLSYHSVMTVMIHELGHSLGIVGADTLIDPDPATGLSTKALFTPETFTAWNSHLRDVFGKPAQLGMLINMNVMTGAAGENDPKVFQIFAQEGDVSQYRYPTFHGKNVDELTGGIGMPVMGGFANAGNALDGFNSLRHSGLMQSVMSYGIIQNMALTEMELAAFQDMGYVIDRSQFFGKSYYYDVGDDIYGTSRTSTTGFGTAANPNTAMLGLGTHIMRNGLSLTQAADIYANGYGGGGVRIDGVGNALTIAQGVTVAANGEMGTGLLVSYGSGNSITVNGRVEATGPGGIGAHFGIQAPDGGISSYMPDYSETHPGWYANLPIQVQYEYLTAYNDLQGPLVENFSLSGTLAGQLAAIKIEGDVHVANITVRDGAVIAGDIVSNWARDTWFRGIDYPTEITFGQAKLGGAMRMDGDILFRNPGRPNSLDIRQAGGHLSYNGQANVYSWRIDQGASLGGNSVITIDGPGPFLNAGLISPGNNGIGAIAINGGYRQSASGKLLMEFTPTAADRFIVNGNAAIDPGANLSLQALSAFYATGSQRELTNLELFNNTLAMAKFTNLALVPITSPTLTDWWSYSGANPVFNVTRAANAYSQYAAGTTGVSLGKALSALATQQLTGDMQNLFAAIDFSRPDGATVRSALRQLAPTAYDNTAKTSLQTGGVLSGSVFEQVAASDISASIGRGRSSTPAEPKDSAFILPAGAYFGQDRWDDNQGFDASLAGILGGANRHLANGLAGLHAAIFRRVTDNRSEASTSSQADGIILGIHGALFPHDGFFIDGLVNAGLENTEMTRSVAIDDYQRQNSASYTAFTAQNALRAGYEWRAGDFRFGPLADLGYGFYHRPAVTEKNGQATRLQADAANFHSLRSALGGQANRHTQLTESWALHAGFSAQWVHELLNTGYGSTASFAGYSGNDFSVENRTDDRDALALNASVALVSGKNLSLAVSVGTELFRAGSNSAQGSLSIGWRF